MKRRLVAILLIGVLSIMALSACKRENAAEESAVAAAKSGKAAEAGKTAETAVNPDGTSTPVAAGAGTQTVTEIPAAGSTETTENKNTGAGAQTPAEKTASPIVEKSKESEPLPEGATGEKEQHANLRLPEGVSFKAICINGAYCKGAEEYIPYSYGALQGEGNALPANAEEYGYWFDAAQVKTLSWEESKGLHYDNRPDCSSYSALIEAFGEDGYIVIGRTSGKREGHLAYFADNPMTPSGIAVGFTLTDFTVEEVLSGGNLNKKIRIKEDYLFGQNKTKENVLYPTALGEFALSDECRQLLFLKKTKNQESYEIFGGNGGFPLTNDYKKYDQEYLDQLAGYLNLNPDYCGKMQATVLIQNSSYYSQHGYADQTGRSTNEALEANKDDLLVALAQKYRIRIWPANSKAYEESNLPRTMIAILGCTPDQTRKDS